MKLATDLNAEQQAAMDKLLNGMRKKHGKLAVAIASTLANLCALAQSLREPCCAFHRERTYVLMQGEVTQVITGMCMMGGVSTEVVGAIADELKKFEQVVEQEDIQEAMPANHAEAEAKSIIAHVAKQ